MYCRYFKSLSRKHHQYYEVLIPNKFTPKSPWGSFPSEKWDEWQELGLHYPERLLNHGDDTTHIPIYSVSHVTHDLPARGIMSTLHSGYYTFKPKLKLGKEYVFDGTPGIGETYKQNVDGKFEKIQRSGDPIFPGFLSWWGINTSPFYKTENGKMLSHSISEIRLKSYYVPSYLREPSASHYGNNSFSTSFKDLLLSYQRSRKDKRNCKVQMKIGGTLLYENEICYVAVIGLEGDRDLQLLPALGDHEDCRPFQHNGLIDSAGVVINFEAIPEFRAFFIVSAVENNEFNWEQLVFALYFPDSTHALECPTSIITRTTVEHRFCISTQPTNPRDRYSTWLCPNKVQ